MRLYRNVIYVLVAMLVLSCEKNKDVPENPQFTSFSVRGVGNVDHTSAVVYLYQEHNMSVIKAGVVVKNIETETKDTFYYTDYINNYIDVKISDLTEGTFYECHGFIESLTRNEQTGVDTFYTIPDFIFDSVFFNKVMTDDTLFVMGKNFNPEKNISAYFNYRQWLIDIETEEVEYTEEDSVKLILHEGYENGLKFTFPAFMEDSLKRGFTDGDIYIWQDNYKYSISDTIRVYTYHPHIESITPLDHGHTLEVHGQFGNTDSPLITIGGTEIRNVGRGYTRSGFFHQTYILELNLPSILPEGKHTLSITIDKGYSVSHDVVIDYTD